MNEAPRSCRNSRLVAVANKVPMNTQRDYIMGLESDIRDTMQRGFPFLIFNRRLEQNYLSDTMDVRRNRFFIMGMIAVLIYNLFLFTDREVLPDIYLTAWKIRLGIVTPAMIMLLFIIRRRVFMRMLDYFVDSMILLTAGSIILILALSHHPNVVHYHTGIILIVMFGSIVVRLRFWHAFCTSWLTFVLYVLTVSRIATIPSLVVVNSSIVLFSAIVISLIANYQMENDLRWNYLRNLLKEIETIRLEKAKAELEHLSSSDVLTGLTNRRYFDSVLDKEWRTAIRNQTPVSLLFLDVDDFKTYNDNYGHQAGDVCLQQVAAVIRRNVHRSRDLCARYGGEEFVVLLPDTAQKSAFSIAETIRASIEMEKIPHSFSRAASHVTVSIGVASITPQKGTDQSLLIEMADQALYRAKELGRNQVRVFMPGNQQSGL